MAEFATTPPIPYVPIADKAAEVRTAINVYSTGQTYSQAQIEAIMDFQGFYVPDPDAILYVTEVETALGTTIETALPSATNPKRIISDFIKAEKAASRWTLHKRIYLPIYNNAAASAVDMVSRLSGTFTGLGSVTHAAGYVNGDGSTGYFDSGIGLPAVGGSNASGSTWAIIPQRVTGVARYEGVNGSGTERISLGTSANDFSQFILPSSVTVAQIATPETSAGIMISSTTSTSSRFVKFRKSGAFATGSNTTLDTTVIPSGDLFFLARNNNDAGIIFAHTERRGGYGFGLGLTEAQAEGFAANLEALYEGLTGITLP